MLSRLSRVLLVGVLLATGAVVGALGHVSASATVMQHPTGVVRGAILSGKVSSPRVRMMWFTDRWEYLGSRRAYGLYSLRLPPGRYRLQFVDRRPTYDITRFAPADARVVVRAGHTTVRNVRMHRGAAITGTVRTHGTPGGHAKLIAARTDGQSFQTVANGKGQFAIGGLPDGSYSVFTYDHRRSWVGKSLWVPHLSRKHIVNTSINLKVRAGRMLIDLYGVREPLRKPTSVTVVSKRTGQFWSARSAHGSVTFPALFPGHYRLIADGAGDFLGARGPVHGARVRAGGVAFGSFRFTRHGATVSGTVVDGLDPSYPLAKAQVVLYDRNGHQVGGATTAKDGRFRLGGQLTSQPGMTAVVNPDPSSGGWMQAKAYCEYTRATAGPFRVVTGRDTALGQIRLPHRVTAGMPAQCKATPTPTPTPTPAPVPEPGSARLMSATTLHRGNPFRGHRLLVVPDSAATAAVGSSTGARHRRLARLAAVPTGVWLTPEADPPGAVGPRVTRLVTDAAKAGKVVLLVVYGIPARDCAAGESAGGLTPAAYRPWVAEIAAATRGGGAAVVLEPDALATAPGCHLVGQRERLLSHAVEAFAATRTPVYLDAGHANWLPARTMAGLLRRAGLGHARGFSVNVAGYDRVRNETRYARTIRGIVGGHYVVDSGRAGAGSNGQWCNPTGRALGVVPHAAHGRSGLDADLWVKPPGESDGTCNGGPPAGTWWTKRALALARNAGW